jgi:hypothetical protein
MDFSICVSPPPQKKKESWNKTAEWWQLIRVMVFKRVDWHVGNLGQLVVLFWGGVWWVNKNDRPS